MEQMFDFVARKQISATRFNSPTMTITTTNTTTTVMIIILSQSLKMPINHRFHIKLLYYYVITHWRQSREGPDFWSSDTHKNLAARVHKALDSHKNLNKSISYRCLII